MKKREIEKSVDRHIRIYNTALLEQIDEVMKHPGYKSFGRVINDALYYGLPLLLEELNGKVKLAPTNEPPIVHANSDLDRELNEEMIKVLKEILLTENINKSIISSVFNSIVENQRGNMVECAKLASGDYAYTPSYLEEYEIRELKSLSKKD